MEATELRKKKTELEKEIQKLVIKFINEVGICEVYVDVTNRAWKSCTGEIQNMDTRVRVHVEI